MDLWEKTHLDMDDARGDAPARRALTAEAQETQRLFLVFISRQTLGYGVKNAMARSVLKRRAYLCCCFDSVFQKRHFTKTRVFLKQQTTVEANATRRQQLITKLIVCYY